MSKTPGLTAKLTTCTAVIALAATFTVAPAGLGSVGIGPMDDAAYAKGKDGGGGNGKGGGGNGKGGGGKGGGKGAGKGGERGHAGAHRGGGNPFKGIGNGNRGGGNRGGGNGLARALNDIFDPGGQRGGHKKASTSRGNASAVKAARATAPQSSPAPAPRTAPKTAAAEQFGDVHPSLLGKWNAVNASPNAYQAKYRNGNYNGPVGALAQLSLAGKAAEVGYEGLSDVEKAALDDFGILQDVTVEDADLATVLNGEIVDENMPVYEVQDGMVTCINCSDLGLDPETTAMLEGEAQTTLDGYVSEEQAAADSAAIEDFFRDSEQRILDESNKSYDEEAEDLVLDHLADELGIERLEAPEAETDEMAKLDEDGNELIETGIEEEILIIE